MKACRKTGYTCVAFVLFLFVSFPAVATTVLYQAGFESPVYAVGALAGKDGWAGSNAVLVQTATAKSGGQAAALVPTPGLPQSFVIHPLSYSLNGNPESIVRISIDMFLSASGTHTFGWVPLFIAGVKVTVEGGNTATFGLASSAVGSVPVKSGVWNTFVLELNQRTGTATAFVNGATIGSGPFTGTMNAVGFGLLADPAGVASDSGYFDNLLVTSEADAGPLTFTRLAGPDGGPGFDDGIGSAARFNQPLGLASDRNGNLYVADTSNATIRKIAPDGSVTTLAGLTATTGNADGTGSAARFKAPWGTAVDAAGNIFVADRSNHTICRITPDGTVSTFAGTAGQFGNTDGTGSGALLNRPAGIAVDGNGTLYVTEAANTIRKITPSGVVTTLAGLAGVSGSADGTGSAARFSNPIGVATDLAGNVYVADGNNSTIRKISASGVVSTLAGTAGQSGSQDGIGSAARFVLPFGLTVDSTGNLYISDQSNLTIRKLTPSGMVSTIAGQAGSLGGTDGIGAAARFNSPSGLTMDGAGNIYVADSSNSTVRKITPGGMVTTVAGLAFQRGTADGSGNAARFNNPAGVVTDAAGNAYISEAGNHTIRKITATGLVTTLAGSPGQAGSADGTGSNARFNLPFGLAIDGSGNVYVADSGNSVIRKITPAGLVSVFAGSPNQPGSADGFGSAARFNAPLGVTADGVGNLFVADTSNHTIRKITSAGLVSTLAGSALQTGHADGVGTSARFYSPYGMTADGSGNVYVADTNNFTIRKITSAGVVTTIAGIAGKFGPTVDGPASEAVFAAPTQVAVDGIGNVFISDSYTIHKISPAGFVTTIAGLYGYNGAVEGTGRLSRISTVGVAVDRDGAVYIPDFNAQKILVGKPALPDTGAIDLAMAPKGSARLLSVMPDTADSWQWSVVRRPVDSNAALSSATAHTPTFTPDKPGLYTFRLVATRGGVSSITTVDLAVPLGDHHRAVRH